MKKVQSLAKTLLLILFVGVLLGVVVTGCSKDDKGPEEEDSSDGYAKIELEDGSVIELKNPSRGPTGGMSPIGSLSTSLTGKGVIIIIQVLRLGEPTVGQQFTLPAMSARNVADETYRSTYYKDKETGEEGEGEVTITAVGDNHIEATFSAVMYSESGKRATMEGKFSQDLGSILD